MPQYFNSTSANPKSTKVRKGYKDGNWIQKAIKKPGSLRKSLGAVSYTHLTLPTILLV